MKKLASLVLTLTALLMLCLSHAAADTWNLRLPEDLTQIRESAFEGDVSLSTVYVGDKVESIGSHAFANSSLLDIRLPESLTELAPDAFLNVPHVEIYGTWNEDLLSGLDNVAKSGSVLPANETSPVPAAAGQEVLRKVQITMTGSWYFGVENCSSAALYTSEGEKIADLALGEHAYYRYQNFTETGEVFLAIRNDSDALIEAAVYIESPFQVLGLLSLQQAELKDRDGGASLLQLAYPSSDIPLKNWEAHQYCSPSIRTTFDRTEVDYDITLYVDDILVRHWDGTFHSPDDDTYDFLLTPADVMKFSGFDKGEHSVRIIANGSVTEYTYSLTGSRKLQHIGQTASSLYLLPGQHVFASFTAEAAGEYTFVSDIPRGMDIFGRLIDEDGNVLSSKLEVDPDSYDFSLSAELAEGQTVTLEAWLAPQEADESTFYGVVAIIVNNPLAEGIDLLRSANCRALVIGQTYETTKGVTQLPGCRNDAEAMAAMLRGLQGSPYAVTPKLDLDAAEILAAIPAAFAGATEKDVSLFYYSGHGQTGSGALVGNDNEVVTPEALKAALDSIPGTKIVLLDSCFSGYFIGRSDEEAATAQEALEHFMSVFSWTPRGEGSSYYVLTASSLYETSIGYKGSCSLFTRHLLAGMGFDLNGTGARTGSRPADYNNDGMFTLNELFVYCRNNIRTSYGSGQTVCSDPYNCHQVLFSDIDTDLEQ